MEESLILEIDDAVAILTINDAPYNRMSLGFMDALEEMVTKIEKDDSIRAVVLTANGLDNFSVGMNLKQFSEGVEKKGSSDALFDQRLKVIAAIETMQKPTPKMLIALSYKFIGFAMNLKSFPCTRCRRIRSYGFTTCSP